MSAKNSDQDDLPEDYPGRIVRFPTGTERLIVTLLGVQGEDPAARHAFIDDCTRLAQGAAGPARLERGECVDASGMPTSLLMAYWSDSTAAATWWDSQPVSEFWQALSSDGALGYFVERMNLKSERFNYAAGTEDKHGSAAVLPLEPSSTFGYWGAYRDRLPASKTDKFESLLEKLSVNPNKPTHGQRIKVEIPDNICYIREGQGWGDCEPVEREIWEAQMDGVVGEWVARLGGDPVATGCMSIRDCAEFDAVNGAAIDRRTQIAFLLSLGHIEQAARTDPAHLAVHGAFVKMYREPQFKPKMHVWVEVGVMKKNELDTEYVNCHPGTGLLPYFG